MKKLILILAFFSTIHLFAQESDDVTRFYTAKNKALTHFALSKDTSSLVAFYTQCIKDYDNVMLQNIEFDEGDGLEYAIAIGDHKSAIELFKYEITTGLSKEMFPFLKPKVKSKEFLKKPKVVEIIENYTAYRNIYIQHLDYNWVQTMASCSETDTRNRSLLSGSPSWITGNAYMNFAYLSDSLRKRLFNDFIKVTDSLNYALIAKTYKNHGFPTSAKARGGLGFLSVHLYGPRRDQYYNGISSTHFLDSIMYKAILAGEYDNREYIFFKDVPEYPYAFSTKSTFGCAVRGKDGYYIPSEIIDIKNVDKRRAKIFLPPLWVDAAIKGYELPKGYVKP
ncbi:MAG: hypothetical protein COA58_12925 [Bacteroidetes bacterium]|nr:MAG: hypothetical protein COA58_12925 [Bacteroidota bacterium]